MLLTTFAHFSLPEMFVQLTPLQESVAIGNKVALLLLHINSLDALFSTPPGNVPELERRDELILYAVFSACMPCSDFFPANSGTSRDDYGRCPGSQGFSSSLIRFNATCSGFLGTCRRPSSTIRFVYNQTLFSELTRTADGTTNDNRQSRIKPDGK